MSNYFGYVSVDALMDFAHNHVNGMIDSNDIARFPKANVKDANEQQSLQEIFEIPFDRLRELAEAERKGKIKIGSDWTPCTDGLPEIAKRVIVTVAGEIVIAAREHEIDDDETTPIHWYDDEGYRFNDDVVTAWMPKPSPYNPDRKEERQ